MKNNSYFVSVAAKVPHYFFFNDRNEDDTLRAFQEAQTVSNNISVYQPPRNTGPWDRVGIIGHRRRGQILADMSRTAQSLELFFLKEELESLDRIYYEAGRDTVPVTAVAA